MGTPLYVRMNSIRLDNVLPSKIPDLDNINEEEKKRYFKKCERYAREKELFIKGLRTGYEDDENRPARFINYGDDEPI